MQSIENILYNFEDIKEGFDEMQGSELYETWENVLSSKSNLENTLYWGYENNLLNDMIKDLNIFFNN